MLRISPGAERTRIREGSRCERRGSEPAAPELVEPRPSTTSNDKGSYRGSVSGDDSVSRFQVTLTSAGQSCRFLIEESCVLAPVGYRAPAARRIEHPLCRFESPGHHLAPVAQPTASSIFPLDRPGFERIAFWSDFVAGADDRETISPADHGAFPDSAAVVAARVCWARNQRSTRGSVGCGLVVRQIAYHGYCGAGRSGI